MTTTPEPEPIRYSMIIEWEPVGGVYVVTVPELPGCKTHGATYEEAVRQGQDAIESWIDAVRYWGHEIPPPVVEALNVFGASVYWLVNGSPASATGPSTTMIGWIVGIAAVLLVGGAAYVLLDLLGRADEELDALED